MAVMIDEEKDQRPAVDDSSDDEASHKVRSKLTGAKQQRRVASPKKNGRLSAQVRPYPFLVLGAVIVKNVVPHLARIFA